MCNIIRNICQVNILTALALTVFAFAKFALNAKQIFATFFPTQNSGESPSCPGCTDWADPSPTFHPSTLLRRNQVERVLWEINIFFFHFVWSTEEDGRETEDLTEEANMAMLASMLPSKNLDPPRKIDKFEVQHVPQRVPNMSPC